MKEREREEKKRSEGKERCRVFIALFDQVCDLNGFVAAQSLRKQGLEGVRLPLLRRELVAVAVTMTHPTLDRSRE